MDRARNCYQEIEDKLMLHNGDGTKDMVMKMMNLGLSNKPGAEDMMPYGWSHAFTEDG